MAPAQIDRARCRRETDAAVAAFLAAVGAVKTVPGFRSGALNRHTGEVIGVKRDADGGWIVVVAGSYGQFWAYQADHSGMARPKMKSIVGFELVPVPSRTGHVDGRIKAVGMRDAT